MTHQLSLDDRDQPRYRWRAVCSCGWRGLWRRHVKDAINQHRQHKTGVTRSALCGTWRRPTPESDLPECLRASV